MCCWVARTTFLTVQGVMRNNRPGLLTVVPPDKTRDSAAPKREGLYLVTSFYIHVPLGPRRAVIITEAEITALLKMIHIAMLAM